MLLTAADCEELCPAAGAGAEVLTVLRRRGLLLAALFVTHNSAALAALCHCSVDRVELLQRRLCRQFSAVCRPADQLVASASASASATAAASTGGGVLEQWLLQPGELAEVFGEAGAGKSQLAAALAACVLARRVARARVLVVESGAATLHRRVGDLLPADLRSSSDGWLSRLMVCECRTAAQLLALLDRLWSCDLSRHHHHQQQEEQQQQQEEQSRRNVVGREEEQQKEGLKESRRREMVDKEEQDPDEQRSKRRKVAAGEQCERQEMECEEPDDRLSLLIVDSLYELFSTVPLRHSSVDPGRAPALLHETAAALKTVARHLRMAVIVTNRCCTRFRSSYSATSSSSTSSSSTLNRFLAGCDSIGATDRAPIAQSVPALGPAWLAAPHTRLLLHAPTGGPANRRHALLLKSCCRRVPCTVTVDIGNNQLSVLPRPPLQ